MMIMKNVINVTAVGIKSPLRIIVSTLLSVGAASLVLGLIGLVFVSCDAINDIVNDGNGTPSVAAYTCSNGIPATGTPAGNSDVEKCQSCQSTYKLVGDTCTTRTAYTCTEGTPASGTPAGNSDVEKCTACTAGHTPQNERCTDEFNYTCSNGTAASGTTRVPNTEKCQSCESTYKLVGDTCTTRTAYTCTEGTPASGTPAGNSDVEECTECNAGFTLTEKKCVADGGTTTLTGTSGDDTLTGTAAADTIEGLAGNDTISGGDGDDTITGGDGDDTITGGEGTDTLSGGTGNDTFIFGAPFGHDTITDIGSGDDTLRFVDSADLTYQWSAADLTISQETDTVTLNAAATTSGSPQFTASRQSFGVLHGNLTVERTDIEATMPTHIGTSGNDTITGGTGNDRIEGLAGDDTINGGDGDDTIAGGDGDDTLSGGDGDDRIVEIRGTNTINGGKGDDTLSGGNGNDTINGGEGNDTLIGGSSGNNILNGGPGADSHNGRFGNTTVSYSGSPAGVTVNLLTGSASGGDASGDTFEDVEGIIGSDHADTLTANDGLAVIQLTGGGGNDTLNSGGAIFTIIDGGSGTDTLTGDQKQRDLFRIELDARAPDIVTNFNETNDGEKDRLLLISSETAPTDLTALQNLFQIRWDNSAHHDTGTATNDAATPDTVIYYTGGDTDDSNDEIIMVLEDYTTDLVLENFSIQP